MFQFISYFFEYENVKLGIRFCRTPCRYQMGLETLMKGSDFVFLSIDGLHYKCHGIRLNRGRSYIDSPDWMKNKKATINPKNNDGKCFQYAVTIALNHKSFKNNPKRISKIKPFTDKYNRKETIFPSHIKDWKKFESNNKSITPNVLCVENDGEIK